MAIEKCPNCGSQNLDHNTSDDINYSRSLCLDCCVEIENGTPIGLTSFGLEFINGLRKDHGLQPLVQNNAPAVSS